MRSSLPFVRDKTSKLETHTILIQKITNYTWKISFVKNLRK